MNRPMTHRQVSTSTVYRLSGQMRKIGSVDLQTSQRERKAALTEEGLHEIDRLIIARPDIKIDKIIEQLEVINFVECCC